MIFMETCFFLGWMRIFQIIVWHFDWALGVDVRSRLAPSVGRPRASLPSSLFLFSLSLSCSFSLFYSLASCRTESTLFYPRGHHHLQLVCPQTPAESYHFFFLLPLVDWSMLPTIPKRTRWQELQIIQCHLTPERSYTFLVPQAQHVRIITEWTECLI